MVDKSGCWGLPRAKEGNLYEKVVALSAAHASSTRVV
jgi:hypothetical protein